LHRIAYKKFTYLGYASISNHDTTKPLVHNEEAEEKKKKKKKEKESSGIDPKPRPRWVYSRPVPANSHMLIHFLVNAA